MTSRKNAKTSRNSSSVVQYFLFLCHYLAYLTSFPFVSDRYQVYRDSTRFAYDIVLVRVNLLQNKSERYVLRVCLLSLAALLHPLPPASPRTCHLSLIFSPPLPSHSSVQPTMYRNTTPPCSPTTPATPPPRNPSSRPWEATGRLPLTRSQTRSSRRPRSSGMRD